MSRFDRIVASCVFSRLIDQVSQEPIFSIGAVTKSTRSTVCKIHHLPITESVCTLNLKSRLAIECTIYKDLIHNHDKELKDSHQDSLLLVYKYLNYAVPSCIILA